MRILQSILFAATLGGCALIASVYAMPLLAEYLPLGIKIAVGCGLATLGVRHLRISSEASESLRK